LALNEIGQEMGMEIETRKLDPITSNHSRNGTMKKIIETNAQALVDQPDHVSVTEIDGLQTSIVELTVAKADIGKQGRTAAALRTLLCAVSAKWKKRAVLEIVE
jgi:predicted RNA-binding protein YlqC (UPF0109 family)